MTEMLDAILEAEASGASDEGLVELYKLQQGVNTMTPLFDGPVFSAVGPLVCLR